ncbi:MAG: putative fibronectin type III-like fold domain, partial [Bacteroidota bacterium]
MNKKFLLKNFLLLPMLLFVAFISNAQTLTESFDNVTFPPTGWTNAQIGGGIDTWTRSTATTQTNPNAITPHSGAGMALYDAYNYAAGESADLATPSLNFTGGPQRVKFWMYRDSRYSLSEDSLEVFVNSTSASSVGGTKIGAIYRHYLDAPAQTAVGWYQYTFNVPASFVGASNYIVFRANSDYGTEMVIDDVVIELQPLGCSGTPSAGTISGPATACSATNFTLTAVGATEGQGMSYQWQSAPAVGGPWTNIAGQTSFNLASVSQTALTYYRLVATCSNSSTSANSNVVSVGLKGLSECYCQPPANPLHSFVNDYVSNFAISGTTLNSSNATNASTGYTLVPPTPANNTGDLQKLSNYTFTATLTNFPGGQAGVWLDLNQNGTFEGSEYIDLVVSADLLTASASVQISGSAVEGLTGLRLRIRAATFLSTGACTSFGSGETEDYTVNITAPGAVVNGAIVDIIPPSASCNATSQVVVKLRNSGSLNIDADAATVALYVNGANPQGPLLLTNDAVILPGDTATLTFTASFPIDGTNIDSVFIQSLAGDNFPADDSLLTAHVTLPPAVAAPSAEDFEGSVAGWTISQISGTGNWSLASGVSYPDFSPAYTLAPKSGTTVALFDSYNFTAGTAARLNTNCITLPANANADCGYVVGFYMAQDAQYNNLDSIVVRITTDGGNSYTRLGKVKRQDSTLSPTLAQQAFSTPEWRLYTFDVANYAGQTVQFALDAYSLYGNQMAIDSFFVGPKSIGGNVA